MAKEDLKKLRSKDPEERKSGIRGVAKSLDRNALLQLATMAGDDPDPNIRKLAQQAGVYIRQKTGDIEVPNPKPSDTKSSGAKHITVDDASAQKAQKLMEYASFQSENGDKAKAMKALVKAAELDPNLRNDSFYISLSETLTNLEGNAAINALRDESRIEQTVQKDVQIKLDKEVKAHQDEVSTASGRDVLFDSGLFLLISVVVGVVLLFLTVYQASQYKTNLEANRKLVTEALDEPGMPRVRWIDGEIGVHPTFDFEAKNVALIYAAPYAPPPAPEPAKTEVMKPTELFEKSTMPYWSDLGIGRAVVRGIGFGLIALLAVWGLLGVTHLFARTFFGGDGRFAYTAHRLLTLYTGRAVLLVVIGFVGIMLYFGGGGDNSMATIFLVILGIFAFFTFLTSATTVKNAYRFGIFSAIIVILLGLVVAILIGGAGGFFLTQIV
ncbi:MAG: YIP1 family protein [Anaerolineae bacterium]|nr:YIP1 family protein [Anaerolineae bacterium]